MRAKAIDQSEIDDLLTNAEAMGIDPNEVHAEAWLGGPKATRSGGYVSDNRAARAPAAPVEDDNAFMSAAESFDQEKGSACALAGPLVRL